MRRCIMNRTIANRLAKVEARRPPLSRLTDRQLAEKIVAAVEDLGGPEAAREALSDPAELQFARMIGRDYAVIKQALADNSDDPLGMRLHV